MIQIRTLFDKYNNYIIVLKPNYDFLTWKLPDSISSKENPYLSFRKNFFKSAKAIQKQKSIDISRMDRDITEAWKNADEQVRIEYEKLYYLNKVPDPSTSKLWNINDTYALLHYLNTRSTTYIAIENFLSYNGNYNNKLSQPGLLFKRKRRKRSIKINVQNLAAINRVPLPPKVLRLFIFMKSDKLMTLFKFQFTLFICLFVEMEILDF
ncbi:17714_t:CDS:1 [Funneliformis geosporum]|uniref:3465_t:CDS:1 n=1 Tax=Funneliformis geosporum TaxID=1117311 RepID=A0A9W4SII9_9GLOM|nr:17714_t:CDS:1 [Funneliformis geosporum]CAI2170700.1 3465_t:CDS:1 [Funneliformis geosporum]